MSILAALFAAPLRLARWYGRQRGLAGISCGGCGAPPGAGERLCEDCWASRAAAP